MAEVSRGCLAAGRRIEKSLKLGTRHSNEFRIAAHCFPFFELLATLLILPVVFIPRVLLEGVGIATKMAEVSRGCLAAGRRSEHTLKLGTRHSKDFRIAAP